VLFHEKVPQEAGWVPRRVDAHPAVAVVDDGLVVLTTSLVVYVVGG
jgi:hypothetical protein